MTNRAAPMHTHERHPRLRAYLQGLAGLLADLKRENLFRIMIGIAGLVLASATVVFISESRANREMYRGYFDAIWWAVVTWASVGYGDKYPITVVGRIAAMVFQFAGVAFTAVLSGTIASIFVERKLQEGKGLQAVILKNHVIICGWNQNAERLFDGLRFFSGLPTRIVLVNEMDPEDFQALASRWKGTDIRFVRGDFTREEMLKKAAVQNARAVIILADATGKNGMNADERTILATLAVKHANPQAVTSAEICSRENEVHLRRARVDDIVVNGEFNGYLLAGSAASSGIPRLAKEIFTPQGRNAVRVREIPASFVGRSFMELSAHFLQSGEGILIGLLSTEKKMSIGDVLAGDSSAIDAFIKRKFEEANMEYVEDESDSGKVKINPDPQYSLRDTDKAFLIGQPG